MLVTRSTATAPSTGISFWLPAAKNNPQKKEITKPKVSHEHLKTTSTTTTTTTIIPSYEERCSDSIKYAQCKTKAERSEIKLFVPRNHLKDYNDGGAFPEIHVAQYPRNMGNPHLAKKREEEPEPKTEEEKKKKHFLSNTSGALIPHSDKLINLEIDSKGNISYDAIVTGGTNANKKVYTSHDDLLPKDESQLTISTDLPTQEEEEETANRTKEALQSLIQSHVQSKNPKGVAMLNAQSSSTAIQKTDFIQYTPREDTPGYNPAAKQRIIQMVPAQLDPMAPPSEFTIQKAPRGPAEDPVPVLHSAPAKLTKEEREAWNIPACISNWKNTRGYTIPLDKRLAADGRGLRENVINEKFATLSESLYIAERQAREEVRLRSIVQKRLIVEEKERKEEELRRLANEARMQRSGASMPNERQKEDSNDIMPTYSSSDEDDEVQQREEIRNAQKKKHIQDIRMQNNPNKRTKFESERDVSEQIALGQHSATSSKNQVDSRLYNQVAGLDSGFGHDDEEYTTYTKSLYKDHVESIYKPTVLEDADEEISEMKSGNKKKFVRSGPVQFEKK